MQAVANRSIHHPAVVAVLNIIVCIFGNHSHSTPPGKHTTRLPHNIINHGQLFPQTHLRTSLLISHLTLPLHHLMIFRGKNRGILIGGIPIDQIFRFIIAISATSSRPLELLALGATLASVTDEGYLPRPAFFEVLVDGFPDGD